MLAAAAVVVLFLAGCSISNRSSSASSTRLTSPSASPEISAGSKAADLRTRLDLVLAEHVMVVAKESAAVNYHSDEATGYFRLLATNGSALVDVMRSAFGNSAATQFDQVWSIQNGYFVDYTIGLVTHDQAKADGAMSGLLTGFVPQLSQLVTSLTQLPLDPMQQLATQQVLAVKAVIDDQFTQNQRSMYADLHTAYAHSSRIGDAIAVRIVQKYPDKFPGDPSSKAVDVRVSLNTLLQEHAYLATMATDAIAGGRDAERSAAANAVAANADALGTVFSALFGTVTATKFDQLWAARDTDLVAYATSGDGAVAQRLTDTSTLQLAGLLQTTGGLAVKAIQTSARNQVQATLKAIDDQRTKAFAQLADDDRAAAAAMEAVADPIVDAAVASKPSAFKPQV